MNGNAISVTPQTPTATPGSSVGANKIGGVPGDSISGKLVVAPIAGNQNLKVTGGGGLFHTKENLIDGKLLCPIIGTNSEGANGVLVRGCQALDKEMIKKSTSKATNRGKSNGMSCDDVKRVGGLGGAFWDGADGGQCWACPVLMHRAMGTDIHGDTACTAGNDDAIVWQSAQYPEPGVAAFTNPEIVEIAFHNPEFVDAFLAKRASAGSKLSSQMWDEMINSPNDSPEFKALIYAAILLVAQKDEKYATRAADMVSMFEDYIKQRRNYITRDAIGMYNAYLDLNAYKQWKAAGQQMLGGGPLGYMSKGTGAIITSPSAALSATIGIPPDDYVGAAYGAATPDARGEDFLRAVLALSGTDYKEPSAGIAETDPIEWATLGVLATDSAARIHDALEANHVIKGLSFLEGRGGMNFGLGLSMVGGALDLIAAAMTLHEQEEAAQKYEELIAEARKDVSIREILNSGSDEEKNTLLMWWALATSPYRASDTLAARPMKNADVCQNYPMQCADIKRVVDAARLAPRAKQGGVALPAPPELVLQIDATKSLAQLLSGVNSAATATAAKPKITAAVARVNQAASGVKKLTGPAWGGANQHKGELDAANAQVKKEVTRIQGLPAVYPLIKDALAPLNLALPGGRAPTD